MEEQELMALPLEELFARAEELTGRLQNPELALEESFEAYQEGMKIIQACNSRIDQVEKQMLAMNREGGIEPFEPAAD
jgi:exodeoxyribonuclease VII small subunit